MAEELMICKNKPNIMMIHEHELQTARGFPLRQTEIKPENHSRTIHEPEIFGSKSFGAPSQLSTNNLQIMKKLA